MPYFEFYHKGELAVSAERSDGQPCSSEALSDLLVWCRDLVRDVNTVEAGGGNELESCKIDKVSIDPDPLELRFVLKLAPADLKINYRIAFVDLLTETPKVFARVIRGDLIRIESYHAADVFLRKAVLWMLLKGIVEIDTQYGAIVV